MGGPGIHPAAVAATTPEARRGRALAERLVAHLPTGTLALSRLVLGLPHSGLRERILRYLTRRTLAAYNRGDWELNTLVLDDERYALSFGEPERDKPPGGRDAYHGITGYLEFVGDMHGVFGTVRFHLLRLLEPRPGMLVGVHKQIMRGTGSGVEFDMLSASAWEFEDGRVVRHRFWTDAEAAMRSLGLPPLRGRR